MKKGIVGILVIVMAVMVASTALAGGAKKTSKRPGTQNGSGYVHDDGIL